MDSFEANKIFGALLGTVFVLFGGSLLADGIFSSEAPEQPGFAIAVPDAPAAGGAAPAGNEVTPVGQLMQNASAEAGANIFKRCAACHSGEKGGPNKVGPDLWDVVNRPIASHEGFSYSAAMTEFAQGGSVVWDWEHLNQFLHGPRQYINGTAMGFAGVTKDQERADLLAYLGTLSDNPAPPPPPEAGAPEGEAAAEGAAPAEGAPAEGAPAAEGQAPAGDPAAQAPTTPNATTNTNVMPGDAVSQPQGAGTTDATTGAAPTAPPSGSVPATGDNAVSAPADAPTPPATPGEAAPAEPGTQAPQQNPAPSTPEVPSPSAPQAGEAPAAAAPAAPAPAPAPAGQAAPAPAQ